MAKPKAEEEEKPDGLEITSIGSIYNGAWDKKYWSSSRGKDRYPYPVGYQAVRAYNGIAYKMKVHEGPKGPLFVITSADGHSCSGQTPDIAWEKFQKKGCPRLKTGHGKRFSCKIDGVEFFGFKNPFVQRLLRELVADVNGTAEQSLLSSSFFNDASKTEHGSGFPDAFSNADLLPYLATPLITGKRSRRCEIINTKLVSGGGLKRPRPQDLTCNTKASKLVEGDWSNHNNMILLPSKEEYDINKHVGALPASGHLQSVVGEENSLFPANNGLQFNSVDSDHLRENAIAAKKENKPGGPNYCKSTGVAVKLSTEEKALDRSPDTEVEGLIFPMTTDDQSGDGPVARDSPCINDVNLCVADTLDHTQDNTDDNAPNTSGRSTDSAKDELPAADMVISEESVTESHPERALGTSNSNVSSESSDFDSVGQDIAKSMITVLLPQAIPLLKNASKKKKKAASPSENFPCRVKSQEETGNLVDCPSPGREAKMHNQSTDQGVVVPSSELTKSVVLDSLEDDQYGDLGDNHVAQSSVIAEADRASYDEDKCPPNTRGQHVVVEVQKDLSVFHFDTSGRKGTFCPNEVHTALNERPQEEDIYISESVLGCISPCKKVPPEEIKVVCANLDGNSVGTEVHSEERDLKTAPDHTRAVDTNDASIRELPSPVHLSQKEIIVKTEVAETDKLSFSQIPNRVYTRKRVPNRTPLARKYDGPLSESIICRNFGDDHFPEKYPATGTLPASEINQIGCSDGKPYENDFGAKARLRRQSCDLHSEETTINFKHVVNNMTPTVALNEELVCVSKDTGTSNFVDPPAPHIENSPAHSDKELDEHENLQESKSSILAQTLETSFCDNNTTSNKEIQASLDLKAHRILEINSELQGIIPLVGCYFHPMPIISLLLSTTGNETYICVLCGFPVDKDRTLFMYKVAIKEHTVGYPSFVGHTTVTLPISKDSSGREIALERSGLQITPDGQSLVLVESIRTPYCRKGKIHCLCSTCTSDCFDENSVKIVQIKLGFVSVLAKLKTDDSVQCLLVCEPNYLVSVGKSGKMHLWVMNSTWSAHTEEFVMPASGCIFPCIVELKKIPKCAPLVLGHNGFGEFSIWDISKRIFVSRFSAPATTIYQFFPISLFTWQRKGPLFSHSNVEEHINGIMAATKLSFSGHGENHSSIPIDGEDIAIWLVVSTSNSGSQHNYMSSDCQISPVGCWKLALLFKNTLILGGELDPRAAAIGESSGHGIIGTCDGLVYMWELSTGIKLGTLHHFKGGSVSCIATDDSSSRVLAVADNRGQLLVYLHS